MDQRPFIKNGIDELEQLFSDSRHDGEILQALLDELNLRNTNRANVLKQKVYMEINGHLPESEISAPTTSHTLDDSRQAPVTLEGDIDQSLLDIETDEPAIVAAETAQEEIILFLSNIPYEIDELTPNQNPPLTNDADAVLSSWTAMEVLSPQTYVRPHDLTNGEQKLVADFSRKEPPWLGSGEWVPKKQQLFYHVILGSVQMEKAEGCLAKAFKDMRPERPNMRGNSPVAIATLDSSGCLVENDPVVISSFAWGLPQASQGRIESLRDWSKVGETLERKLIGRLIKYDKKKKMRSLTQVDLDQVK